MKKMIFKSNSYTFKEAEEYLIESGNENPTEEEIYDEINECNKIALNDEITEWEYIGKNIRGELICIVDAGRWNGRKTGYKIFEDLKDIIHFMTSYDEFEIFFENSNLKGIGHHHDGTDYLTFKEVKENFESENVIYSLLEKYTDGKLKYYTNSLKKYFKGYIF